MGEGIASIILWCIQKILNVFDDGRVVEALQVNMIVGVSSAPTASLKVGDGVNAIWDLITGFAMGLIMVYFMWEMNSKWAFEGNDLNMKSLAGPFCKVIFAIILFNNSSVIAQGMINFYNTCITKGSSTAYKAGAWTDAAGMETALTEQCESLGIMSAVIILLPMLAVVLISYVLKFSFIYKALMVKFEFLFRVGFTPLAMADSFNGLNSNSMRWIKGFVGYGVYVAAFLFIPRIGMSITEDFLTKFSLPTGKEGLDFCLEILEQIVLVVAVPFAELGVIGAVKQLSKEAAG